MADYSWMVAFLDDLREIAAERNLHELTADLDELIKRHRASLGAGNADYPPMPEPKAAAAMLRLVTPRRS